MLCPYCKNEQTKVVDKRESTDLATTRRRRECLKCEKRFTTHEHVDLPDLYVVKKDGAREKFDREKFIKGLHTALYKRPVPIERVEQEIARIEEKIHGLDLKEVPSSVIGEEVMKALKRLDKMAYIRFASVYREFADLTEFEDELQKLIKKKC